MYAQLKSYSLPSNQLYMTMYTTFVIEGRGKLILNKKSREELTLNNVFYMLVIMKNLVSGLLPNKHGSQVDF